MTATVRHETKALLRAHLSAASSFRHRTRQCPICYQLLKLAMESGSVPDTAAGADDPDGGRRPGVP